MIHPLEQVWWGDVRERVRHAKLSAWPMPGAW